MAALTAVAIVLVAVVVTVHKCKKRLQGIADFMSECILLLLTLTLQSNSSLVFSEKFKKCHDTNRYVYTQERIRTGD